MLVKFEAYEDCIYVNPDRVFAIKKYSDGMYGDVRVYGDPQTGEDLIVGPEWIEEKTIIWPDDERNYVIVNEPLDQVVEKLNEELKRKRS